MHHSFILKCASLSRARRARPQRGGPRRPRPRPAPAEPPCAGALRWRGPGGSRPWPGRRRWARAAASGSGSPGSVEAAWGKRGPAPAVGNAGESAPALPPSLRALTRGRGSGRGKRTQASRGPHGRDAPGGRGGRRGRGGAPASPDRVVLRGYRLRAVLGLGGGGKARGVSGLNGESPTLRGLLGTHVRARGRSAGGRGRSRAGSSCPTQGAGGRSGPGGAGQVSAARHGPGVEGRLHCDPGRGALTSQSPFLSPGAPGRGTQRGREPGPEGSCHGPWRWVRAEPRQPRGGVHEKEPVLRAARRRPGRTPCLAPGPGAAAT